MEDAENPIKSRHKIKQLTMETKNFFYIAMTIAISVGLTGCLKAPEIDSGTIADVQWVFEFETSTLTFSGTGEILGGNQTFESSYSKYSNLTKHVIIKEGITGIGSSAFLHFGIESVSIPNSVENIRSEAFQWCYKLHSVSIPDGVKRIENSAFYMCSGLSILTIGDGVTSIGSMAFQDCVSLFSLKIGKSVTNIGSHAFNGCQALNAVTCFAVTPPKREYLSFERPDIIDLYVPAKSVSAYKEHPDWKDFRSISAIQ